MMREVIPVQSGDIAVTPMQIAKIVAMSVGDKAGNRIYVEFDEFQLGSLLHALEQAAIKVGFLDECHATR